MRVRPLVTRILLPGPMEGDTAECQL